MSGGSIFETDLRQQAMEAIWEELDQTTTYFENVMQVPICITPGYRFATCQMELRELKLEHS